MFDFTFASTDTETNEHGSERKDFGRATDWSTMQTRNIDNRCYGCF